MAAAIAGAVAIYIWNRLQGADARTQSRTLLDQAKLEAGNVVREAELEAKAKSLEQQRKAESDLQAARDALRDRETATIRREESLQQQASDLKKQERVVETTQRKLTERLEETQRRLEEFQRLNQQQIGELQRLSGLSRDEAAKQLMNKLEQELQNEMGNVILKHQRRIAESAEQKAQDILLTTMQRYASSQTADSTTSTVDIPTDDMKGRIIGREGRNIRAFEKATGIDIIIDDTPGVVIVSGFDPVRREVARQSLEKLISDGRIHPTRIEEIVAQTEKEIDQYVRKKGMEAAEETNIGGLH
ncbi:MAG: Rnase Y domain-containing protein, partial [Pirellulaceae bacterium]